MPISPDPEVINGQPYVISVPMPDGSGMFVGATVQNDGTATTEAMDGTLQSLIDHLQAWPGKNPGADVNGQKYSMVFYPATPTFPVPLPDPPDPEPENEPS